MNSRQYIKNELESKAGAVLKALPGGLKDHFIGMLLKTYQAGILDAIESIRVIDSKSVIERERLLTEYRDKWP